MNADIVAAVGRKRACLKQILVASFGGIVSYNVNGWLEKNKDPVNDTIVEVMKSTFTCELLDLLWENHPGQPTTAPKEEGKKKKKGGGKTVSSVYLVSLVELLTTLYSNLTLLLQAMAMRKARAKSASLGL